jgi:hypothetical protein
MVLLEQYPGMMVMDGMWSVMLDPPALLLLRSDTL